ncbi:MAG: hypothetical protein K1Y36_06635 [Blastocatellia bacterium]|nr:hypothetical protein [Blastocatellia bacterium]
MPLQNIKSYIEIQQIDLITNFREAEGDRIVRAYHFTSELGRLVARLIESIASPRTSAAARILTGKRGAGKSHLMTVVQTLATVPRTRMLVSSNPQVTNAVRRLEGSTYVLLNISGATRSGAGFDFTSLLREALRRAPGHPMEFDDTQWYLALENDQICELICSKLFPGMLLLICLDDISESFRNGKRETVTAMLKWLSLFSTKSRELPLLILGVLDEDVLDAQSGSAARLATEYQIDTLSIDNLRRITDQAIFKKNPMQRGELGSLYRDALRVLPHFRWTEEEFMELYPVHPAVLEVSPGMSAYCESFSLFGFMNASAGRALGRRPLQLISLDELFDRFEFDLRKDPRLQRGLEVYDFLATIIIPGLGFGERLKAKLVLKGIFLYSIVNHPASASDLTDTLMLYEERNPEEGYRQVVSILQQLESQAEGQLVGEGDGVERRYSITIVERFDPEARLTAAAVEMAPDDERLCSLLVTLGGIVFNEWPFSPDALLMANAVGQRVEMGIPWRGTLRRGIVAYASPIELNPLAEVRVERHEERMIGGETVETKSDVGDRSLLPTPQSLPDISVPEVKVTFTYQWAEEVCEYDWQLLLLPASSFNLPSIRPALSSLLFWRPGPIDGQGIDILRKAWVIFTRGEEVLGIAAADRLQQLENQVRELFLKLYVEKGVIIASTGQEVPVKLLWGEGVSAKRFTDFLTVLVQGPLTDRFPLHPTFGAVLTEREVRRLVLGLMGGLNPTDQTVQDYARNFALPMHLVVERDSLFQLSVDRDEALGQPFISEVLRLVEASSISDPVPVQVIYQTLRREPYGLLEPVQQLIIMALIAGWRIELIDVSGLRVFGAAELTQDVSFRQYGTVRRTATISYSSEVLTEWCRLLTERPDIQELTIAQGRKQVREALATWYQKWNEYQLIERFNNLPMEMLTTRTWQLIITCKRYFETTSNAVEAVLHERISLEMGLARIVEVFSANPTLFQRARQELRLLVEFLNWLPYYVKAKNYTLTALQVKDDQIVTERRELVHFFEHPHRLLDEDKRRRFENIFKGFQEHFTNYYATRHDEAMGRLAELDPVEDFLASDLWRTFELFLQLNIANQRYMVLAQELLKTLYESHCALPVRDILALQPYCACGFKLGNPLNLPALMDELKAVVRNGIEYHRRLVHQYRPKLSQNLRALAASQQAGGKDQAGPLMALISGNDPAATVNLTFSMIEFINEALKDEKTVLPASPPPPFILGEHFTKAELKAKLLSWIETLPDEEGLSFEMAEAPLSGD